MGLKVVLSDRWQRGKQELRNPGDSALQPLSLMGSVMANKVFLSVAIPYLTRISLRPQLALQILCTPSLIHLIAMHIYIAGSLHICLFFSINSPQKATLALI